MLGGGGGGVGGGAPSGSSTTGTNRCSSISSCSLGSVDRISTSTSLKAAEEAELIADWLYEINSPDCYYKLFLAAGYDLPTIARMTFEDLTAIGIRTPNEREFLITHIKRLSTPDNLPHYVPNSIREFLRILNMEEYVDKMMEQNFQSVRDICKLIWDDLEDIGIVKLGHQKKILLAIKRIKDILNGKFVATPTNQGGGGGGSSGGGSIGAMPGGGKNGSIGYFSISSQGSTNSVSPSPPISGQMVPASVFNFQPPYPQTTEDGSVIYGSIGGYGHHHQQSVGGGGGTVNLPPCSCDQVLGQCPSCQAQAANLSGEFENEIVAIQVSLLGIKSGGIKSGPPKFKLMTVGGVNYNWKSMSNDYIILTAVTPSFTTCARDAAAE